MIVRETAILVEITRVAHNGAWLLRLHPPTRDRRSRPGRSARSCGCAPPPPRSAPGISPESEPGIPPRRVRWGGRCGWVPMGLHVNHRWMMQVDEDEAYARRQMLELAADPLDLLAARQQGRVAVEVKDVNGIAESHRVPAAAPEFGKGIPPVLKTFALDSVEFVVAQRRVDEEVSVAPDLCFRAIHVVITRLAATARAHRRSSARRRVSLRRSYPPTSDALWDS